MKSPSFALGLILFTLSGAAHAATTWVYRVEPSGLVSGGKMKVGQLGRSAGARQLKFKWKLETSVGFKEGWIPYSLPEKLFDADFLAGLPQGQATAVGNVRVTRQSPDAYLVQGGQGTVRFYARSGGGAWKRIEVTTRGVTVRGNLAQITNE